MEACELDETDAGLGLEIVAEVRVWEGAAVALEVVPFWHCPAVGRRQYEVSQVVFVHTATQWRRKRFPPW